MKEQNMFGKRNSPNASGGRKTDIEGPSTKPGTGARTTGVASGGASGGGDRLPSRAKAMSPAPYDTPRRVADYALPGTRGELGTGRPGEGRKLVVGQDISLAGEIKSCELLIVEGLVEADLKGCRLLQIGETGVFKGSAEVAQAEINGRFDGELTVTDRLFLRSGGHVAGTLRYKEMEVERGGKVTGSIEDLSETPGRAKASGRTASVQSAPAPRAEPAEAKTDPGPERQRASQKGAV